MISSSLFVQAEALTDLQTSATTCLAILLNQYGTDILEWSPETLWLEVMDDFKIDVEESNKDQIQALISAITTDRFYNEFEVFEAICKSLNNEDPDFEDSTPLSPEEASWGIYEVLLNDDEPQEFHQDINSYLQIILRDNGFLEAPEPLKKYVNYSTYNSTQKSPAIIREQEIKHKRISLYMNRRKQSLLDEKNKYL